VTAANVIAMDQAKSLSERYQRTVVNDIQVDIIYESMSRSGTSLEMN
jgi:hypothetical protein